MTYIKIKRSKQTNFNDLFIFYALTWPDFVKTNDSKGAFKKENMKDEHFDVAQTRKFEECGSDEKMRWLALNPLV